MDQPRRSSWRWSCSEPARGLPEPLTTLILGADDIRPLPNNRWAVDATKPSLAEPHRREEFVRLRARGEGEIFLKDFMG